MSFPGRFAAQLQLGRRCVPISGSHYMLTPPIYHSHNLLRDRPSACGGFRRRLLAGETQRAGLPA
jgi:hypothetical protein